MQTPTNAQSSTKLRGDYHSARVDYTIEQEWSQYTQQDHAIWRLLYERQSRLIPHYACDAFQAGLAALSEAQQIPRFDQANELLMQRTGWRLVAVPGFVPDEVFFTHLAARRFPTTCWIRSAEELDYLVEPDVFHDFFGHVPLLTDPIFADFLQAFGRAGLRALELGVLPLVARLYWYTVEFGLIVDTERGLKLYGAGILSSAKETVFALNSSVPNRIGFNAARIMRTNYMIDEFQKTYFVIESFEQLFAALEPACLEHTLKQCADLPRIAAREVLKSDCVLSLGCQQEGGFPNSGHRKTGQSLASTG